MTVLHRVRRWPGWSGLRIPLVVAVALVASLALFRLPVGPSIQLLGEGAFGDRFGWSRTILKATPLLLCGLGMVVAWRGGVYNIGGEGQYIAGGLFGATVAKFAIAGQWPGWIGFPTILLACVLGGAAMGWVAGWLSVKRGVEPVISTILLNFVADQALRFCVSGPLRYNVDTQPRTDALPRSFMFPRFERQLDWNWGCVLALVVAILVYILLFRTKLGYQIRVVGENRRFARTNYVPAGRVQLIAISLSGALCGLAGAVEYMGTAGELSLGYPQQWGFLGIPVALLGGLQPLWTILSALLFGALFAGSDQLARFTTSGDAIVYVIQALSVLAVVALRTRRAKAPAADPTNDRNSSSEGAA